MRTLHTDHDHLTGPNVDWFHQRVGDEMCRLYVDADAVRVVAVEHARSGVLLTFEEFLRAPGVRGCTSHEAWSWLDARAAEWLRP